MITLYHGSTETVEAPRVDAGRLGLDFGPGFYVTRILDQAEKWAQRTSRQRLEPPVVNIYEFDEMKATAYRRLKFDNYDSAWLEFVVACRSGYNPSTEYDYIEGGVANDRVIDTVEGFINGTIDAAHALEELSKHCPNHQICFLNADMVKTCLTYKGIVKDA